MRPGGHSSGLRWCEAAVFTTLLCLIPAAVIQFSCGGSKPAPIGAADETFTSAMELYTNEKWEKAAIEFESYIFSFSGSARVDSAQFLLGMCYYHQEDYIRSTDEFQRLRRRYPTSPLVDDADFLAAKSMLEIAPENPALDQDRTREAITQLNLYKDSHPLSANVAVADSLLGVAYGRLSERDFKAGRLYHRMGRYQAARIMLQEVIDRYSSSPLVPEAVYYIAEGYRHLDSLDRAVEYYEKLIYIYPDHERTGKAKKRVVELAKRQEQLKLLEQPPQESP